MLNRLRRMGAITQAELSRLPDRYSKPHRRMVIETIDLDPDGRNRLIFDVEAILHETAEDYEVPLPPRLAAFRILRNRPLPYDTIRSVRTIRRRRRWSLRLSLLAVILGSFLLATQWRNPTLLALGVVFVIFFGCVPLFLFLMRPAFLLIAAEKTAIAIPMSVEKRARERIIRLLHEVGSESRISWDL